MALVLVVPSTAAVADPPAAIEVTTISDPALVPDSCEDGAAAHTADVAARGGTWAVSYVVGQYAAAVVALTRDGGRTWQRRLVRGLTGCSGGAPGGIVDPDLELGADGTPWLSSSVGADATGAPVELFPDGTSSRLLVTVGDGDPVSVVPGRTVERGFLETSPTDADRGLVLTTVVAGQRGGVLGQSGGVDAPAGPPRPLLLADTSDRGRTWRVRTLRDAEAGVGVLALGLVRTGKALVALSTRFDLKDPETVASLATYCCPRSPVEAQTSYDDGETWSEPVTLAVLDQSTLIDASAGGGRIAVASPQPDGRVLVFTSDDDGRTWRRGVAATGAFDPTTAVAVDGRRGVTVLSYAVSGPAAPVLLPDTRSLRPQVSRSADGVVFAPPAPVGEAFSLSTTSGSGDVPPIGPYQGADVGSGDVLVAFTQGVRDVSTVRLARLRR